MKTTLLLSVILLALAGCKREETKAIEHKSEFIEITKEQFNINKMAFGTPTKKVFENTINSTGKIVPDLNGEAKISATIEGVIKNIHVQVGQYVNEGDAILEIGGISFINMQQDFASSAAKLKQLAANYKRTEKLYKDKIKTENEMMMAQSVYKSELANYEALKLKLESIGLKTKDIEDGIYYSSYAVTAPIKGQIVTMHTALGQSITPQESIADIINTHKIQMQLAIFETDFSAIQVGQKIQFTTLGRQDNQSYATISRIGKILNPESRAFACYAHIDTLANDAFIINQVVRADIVTSTDTAWAVPQNAIVTLGQNHYVYVKEKEDKETIKLDRIQVQVGKSNNGFMELINIPQDITILVAGTADVNAQ